MKKLAIKIKNNLMSQLNLYKYLNRLSHEKKDLIVKGDPESLTEIDKHIQAVTCELIALEHNRLKILDGYVNKNTKLSDFIARMDSEDASVLNALRKELIEVMQSIAQVNRLNMHLIEHSIKWIEHSVNTIANYLVPESAAYNSNGKALTTAASYLDSSGLIEHTV